MDREVSRAKSAEGAEGISATRLTEMIIGAAIEVHRQTGPGLLESTYEACLCYELSRLGLDFQRQVSQPVPYKWIKLDCGYRMDLLVEDTVVIELKTVGQLLPIHSAQLLTYLKLSGKEIGLLLNFNEPVLKNGLKRLVNHFKEPTEAPVPSAPSASRLDRGLALESKSISSKTPRLSVSAVNKEPAVK